MGVAKGNYHQKRNCNIYAAYRGDDYIGEGTLDDIAALASVSRKTAQWCARPAALRRIEDRSKAWDAGGAATENTRIACARIGGGSG